MSKTETAYAVHCKEHGKVCLSREEYNTQMNKPNSLWHCPECFEEAWWDDDHYEEFLERLDRADWDE